MSSTKPQQKEEPAPSGTASVALGKTKLRQKQLTASPMASPSTGSTPSMLKAKKKLRAFSIQKKATIAPVTVPKPVSAGSNTVLIGKLSGVKVTPKPEPIDEAKKPPKPPRPGAQETYIELQKKNVAEIEDMKRKMELVELGIPLGLICPTATSEKGMPSKAMPPIKTFLDPAKVDELIREGKKAKEEGREFKFELHKFLPDYNNPFQRKKDNPLDNREILAEADKKLSEYEPPTKVKEDKRKSSRFDRKYSDYRKDDRHKNDREKYTVKNRERDKKDREKRKEEKREYKKEDTKKDRSVNKPEKDIKETDVHLNDYLVCDSWSLDTDKTNSSSPKPINKSASAVDAPKVKPRNLSEQSKEINKTKEITRPIDSPLNKTVKVEKLQPVMDSFKYELDANDDDVLDLYDEETNLDKYSKLANKDKSYDSPSKLFDYDQEPSTADDENFLESIINEIKQEDMSDISQDKALVEYDLSPKDEQVNIVRESVTPELDDRMRSQQSHYSDGYRSSESGYKSRESGYKSDRSDSYRMSVDKELVEPLPSKMSKSAMESYRSSESGYKPRESGYKPDRSDSYRMSVEKQMDGPGSKMLSKSTMETYRPSDSYLPRESGYKPDRSDNYRMSVEKELERPLESHMSRSTMESLETWSFVLKICQPLLFRHDRNKCYKETHTLPKLWYTENPRGCNCVKDRSIVYGELETCKMSLVDRVYGCDQIADAPCLNAQNWYPRVAVCLTETNSMQLSTEWETEECQPEQPPVKQKTKEKRKSMTPQKSKEMSLDQEYKRFMEALLEVNEAKPEPPRSTTPVRQEIKRKKKEDDKVPEENKKAKRIKLSSEGWSQESEVSTSAEDVEKSKKLKMGKEKRKRKLSTSSLTSSSDSEDHDVTAKKKKKSVKKKVSNKSKLKSAKRRKLSKKYITKKLKEKQMKKRKIKAEKKSEESDGGYVQKESAKEKKARKKKELKLKKAQKKKKAKAKSSSSSSSSESSSETDSDQRRKKKKKEADKKKRKEKKKRKKSSSSSTQSEDLFDVNILKNIKTERLSDEEKNLTDFSPRRQKPREIINVKELQNDFVGNNIHIKQEKEEENIEQIEETEVKEESVSDVKVLQVESQADSLSQIDSRTEDSTADSGSKKSEFKEPEIPTQLIQPLPIPEPQTQQIQPIPKPIPQISESLSHIAEPITQIAIPIAQIPVPPPQTQVPHPQTPVPPPHTTVYPSQITTLPPQITTLPPQIPTLPPQIPVPSPQIPDRPQRVQDTAPQIPDESNNSQCSSQESVCSVKEIPYEKDDSHLRPSSQNSNYSFNDVISASQGMFPKMDDIEDKFESYEQGNYEMYEQLAMAYQSDVANQICLPPSMAAVGSGSDAGCISRIETVVGARRGEIKCDWRAGDRPATHHPRPSRWGLKPGEVNIVLTDGGNDRYSNLPVCAVEPVYQIESIANRTSDNTSMSYDEAYMDMYGASDKLQYGDCFAAPVASLAGPSPERPGPGPEPEPAPARRSSSLDARIDQVLRDTTLSEVAKSEEEDDKDGREKGILMTSLSMNESSRGGKRVSFADGYKPGQDSDVEEPPVKKKKKSRRRGCPWPCPATHPDHVPLWDALPPPPPPPGSPPPPPRPALPPQALAALRRHPAASLLPDIRALGHLHQKFDPNSPLPPFMPPEPPPGIISFH